MGEGISGLVSNVKNWFNDGAFVLEYNSNNATNKFVNRPVSFVTKMAFKNLAIYDGKNLSKDDCIKAYNYLQTLKAK